MMCPVHSPLQMENVSFKGKCCMNWSSVQYIPIMAERSVILINLILILSLQNWDVWKYGELSYRMLYALSLVKKKILVRVVGKSLVENIFLLACTEKCTCIGNEWLTIPASRLLFPEPDPSPSEAQARARQVHQGSRACSRFRFWRRQWWQWCVCWLWLVCIFLDRPNNQTENWRCVFSYYKLCCKCKLLFSWVLRWTQLLWGGVGLWWAKMTSHTLHDGDKPRHLPETNLPLCSKLVLYGYQSQILNGILKYIPSHYIQHTFTKILGRRSTTRSSVKDSNLED